MKKQIIALLLSASMAFIFSSCKLSVHIDPNIPKTDVAVAPANKDSVYTIVSPYDGITSEPVPKKMPMLKSWDYYSIVGESNKLTSKEKTDMEKWRKEVVALSKANSEKVYINGPTNKKTVALTFDDGPDNTITPKILDVLKTNDVHASFFFIGNRLSSYTETVKRADREGNLVLSHSFTHPTLSKKTTEEIDKELIQTEDKLFSIIGNRPSIIRPPYGDMNQAVINEVSKQGYKLVIWSIDTLDWSQREKDNIVKNVVSNVRPGEIILMHSNEDKAATLEALPEMIKKLKDMGYEFLTLDKMLDIKAYK